MYNVAGTLLVPGPVDHQSLRRIFRQLGALQRWVLQTKYRMPAPAFQITEKGVLNYSSVGIDTLVGGKVIITDVPTDNPLSITKLAS